MILASIVLALGFCWGNLIDFTVVPLISIVSLALVSLFKGSKLLASFDLGSFSLIVLNLVSVSLLALSFLVVAVETPHSVQYVISIATAGFAFSLRSDLNRWGSA